MEQNQQKIIELQAATHYQIIFEKNTSIEEPTKQFVNVQPYDINVHVERDSFSSPIINDLHFTNTDIIQNPEQSPEYQIMVIQSPNNTAESPLPPTQDDINDIDNFDNISIASSNEDDRAVEKDYDSSDEWHNSIEGFPKVVIQDAKLVVRGRELFQLMSKYAFQLFVLILTGKSIFPRFYKLQCEICQEKDSVFIKLTSLLEHYEDMHLTKGFVKCCGTKLTKTRAMALHMARHVQPDAFKYVIYFTTTS